MFNKNVHVQVLCLQCFLKRPYVLAMLNGFCSICMNSDYVQGSNVLYLVCCAGILPTCFRLYAIGKYLKSVINIWENLYLLLRGLSINVSKSVLKCISHTLFVGSSNCSVSKYNGLLS